MKNFELIAAKTHPAEYMLHKYWARKPHNVISHYISELVPKGGLVVDPFCGSGVVLKESQKLGIDSVGFDANPIANLISNVLIDPPSVDSFKEAMEDLFIDLDRKVSPYYTVNGKPIKYLIHKTVVKCKCGKKVSQDLAQKKGKSYFCPDCQEKLRFNLESLTETQIKGISLESNSFILDDENEINTQQDYSDRAIIECDTKIYDYNFAENRRILSFSGMKTSSLFTKRNFSILCYVADKIDMIDNKKVRNAAKLLLTASVAQCSRLIPARNNLSTGGPAWSVPGFWVPAEHLETNPLVHLHARYTKFVKGINKLNASKKNAQASVLESDANEGMLGLINEGKKADLVFFDPPYGDSVPYLEFSSMWNSFLRDFPNPNLDLSVSDRLSKTESWSNYYKSINDTLCNISNLLSESGKLLITFNNNDLKAWEALIGGLQNNNLFCDYVSYQIPAVISSKAQFSVEGSYVSDIYSVYTKKDNLNITNSLEPVTKALIKCASARNGIINNNLAQRVSVIAWMENNITVDLLKEKDNLIKSIFDNRDGKLYLKEQFIDNSINIIEETRRYAKEILQNGPIEWNDLFIKIAQELVDYGLPEPSEIRSYLDGYVSFNKKKCLSYINSDSSSNFEQLRLEI